MSRAQLHGAAAGPLGSLYNLGAAGGLTDGQLLERFLGRDDPSASEAAFAELLARHGAMVLDVCRRELRDTDDAHDAFQATFLILVSKAATIRRRDSIAGWLFVIARRVAAQAREESVRRRRLLEQFGRERQHPEHGPLAVSPEENEIDFTPLFDEVSRLPERYRVPVVLHYFEGLSTEATAQRLGCARGTVLSRLSRARLRLKQRMERRGVSRALLVPAAGSTTRWVPPVSVPASLARGTIRAACSLRLAGATIESVVPTKVAALSRRVARTLTLSRASAASLLVIAALGASIGVAAALEPAKAPPQGPAMPHPAGGSEKRSTQPADRPVTRQPVTIRGRVLDPDGRPVAGARLLQEVMKPAPEYDVDMSPIGATGPDGRFEARIQPVPDEGTWFTPTARPPLLTVVAATAPGFGPDWAAIFSGKADEPITLRLRRDDVPLEGRVVSLEGRPIPGLDVRLEVLKDFPPAFLDEIRGNGGRIDLERWTEVAYGLSPGKSELISTVRTDSDGRFRMTGLGRDRAAYLVIQGGSIERTSALALTSGDRDFHPIPLEASFSGARRVEGPRFTVTAAPGRSFEGIVRDRDSGRPIAGARVNDWWGKRILTDVQGRFRMDGQPRRGPDRLSAIVEGQPYVECFTPVKGGDGVRLIRVEMALKRGVWVEGRVIDRATGRPVKAILGYYPTADNPHVKDYPAALFLEPARPHLPVITTDDEGRFRAAVPPGKGLLSARAIAPGYVAAGDAERRAAGNIINPLGFGSDFTVYNAFVPIDLPEQGGKVVPDIPLTRGREQHLRLADADGRPVTGTVLYCLQSGTSYAEVLDAPDLRFFHVRPGQAVTLAFVQESRSLGAKVELKGDEPDPITVTMRPTGTVTGRLLHEDGKPRPGARLEVRHRLRYRGMEIHGDHGSSPVTTGPDGRFAIKDLIPGMTYDVTVSQKSRMNTSYELEGYLHSPEWTVEPGETRDWGDVRVLSDLQ